MKATNTNPLARPRRDDVDFIHRSERPTLSITNKGGANLGRCYNASYFEVVSLKPLDMEDLWRLRECGFLGYGQEFSAEQIIGDQRIRVPGRFNPGKYCVGYQEGDDKNPTADSIKPSGTDMVPCQMYDRRTGEHIPGEAINPYSGKPYEPSEQKYYVYRCESRVDSSD